MSLIPEEELRREKHLNLAPMVDFLFLVVAVLATLAITRSTLHDNELSLVKVHTPEIGTLHSAVNEQYLVHLSVTAKGTYKWITDMDEYLMPGAEAIQHELIQQVDKGLLPKEKEKIKKRNS